ncbi:cysteine proteinase [Panus rudis PR-1116 ss-1]|nr:cysteine proteinase [Panus rudis PR-1116 ss-1]
MFEQMNVHAESSGHAVRPENESSESSMDLVGEPFAVVESDPGVFTMLLRKLGVQGLEVIELYNIEPWAVDHLDPRGLIFCYVCQQESAEEPEGDNDMPDPDAEDIWFANQVSDDACASLAILNIIFNCRDVELKYDLRHFYEDTAKMSAVMKGLSITNCPFIREAQNSLARPADIRAARITIATRTLKEVEERKKKEAMNKNKSTKKQKPRLSGGRRRKSTEKARQESYHFIGYVPYKGKVWELDGLRISGALEVGDIPSAQDGAQNPRNGWMDVVRPALQIRMGRHLDGGASDQIQFNLLAIVEDQFVKTSDALELLKRERAALERRLKELHGDAWTKQVNAELLATADQVFTTPIHDSSPGPTYATDFGSRKLQQDMEILDMPARSLAAAWERCIQSAMSAKVAVEEEIAKSKKTNTDYICRTHDYEPFIRSFITYLHEGDMLNLSQPEDDSQPQTSAKTKGRPPKKAKR